MALDSGLGIVAELTTPTAVGSGGVVAASVVDTVRRLVEPYADHPIDAIGIGTPGQVDASTGFVRHAVNLGITEPFDLGGTVASEFSAFYAVENDVNVAALGGVSNT